MFIQQILALVVEEFSCLLAWENLLPICNLQKLLCSLYNICAPNIFLLEHNANLLYKGDLLASLWIFQAFTSLTQALQYYLTAGFCGSAYFEMQPFLSSQGCSCLSWRSLRHGNDSLCSKAQGEPYNAQFLGFILPSLVSVPLEKSHSPFLFQSASYLMLMTVSIFPWCFHTLSRYVLTWSLCTHNWVKDTLSSLRLTVAQISRQMRPLWSGKLMSQHWWTNIQDHCRNTGARERNYI